MFIQFSYCKQWVMIPFQGPSFWVINKVRVFIIELLLLMHFHYESVYSLINIMSQIYYIMIFCLLSLDFSYRLNLNRCHLWASFDWFKLLIKILYYFAINLYFIKDSVHLKWNHLLFTIFNQSFFSIEIQFLKIIDFII
jgi:hypothetical protein